jgi:hypothetical protein
LLTNLLKSGKPALIFNGIMEKSPYDLIFTPSRFHHQPSHCIEVGDVGNPLSFRN